MRQIKFRAFHKESKQMIDFGFMDLRENEGCVFFKDIRESFIPFEDEEAEWMEYLGEDCKDCEGTPLCEDDIVKDENGIYQIFYNQEFALYDLKGYEAEGIPFNWSDFEKIGNIHQNPELLNEITT